MKTNQKKINRFSVYAFFLSCIIFFTILYGEDLIQLFSQSFTTTTTTTPAVSTDVETERKQKVVENANDLPSSTNYYYLEGELRKKLNLQKWIAFAEENEEGDFCNLFEGKWVWDEEGHHPLYPEETCPYIQPQLTCKEHGRPDFLYQHWRWQPNGCSMPRFNATKMLEALRGKRMLYVGDSLNRGQYVSMVCLIHRLIPEERKSMETNGSLTIFTAKDYNASIEFYWAPFLLESNSDDAVIHRVKDRIIRADSIEKHAQYWKGADILVFNTYLWWMTGYKTKILLRGSFEDEEKVIGEYEVEDAYRLSMKSMARWVEQNMDPSTTRVFFTSMSPTHENGKEWGDEGGNCFNQTMPILDDLKFWGGNSKTSIMKVIGEVFSEMSVPITLLNITQLSLYRKDAHTQIYKKQWTQPTPEQMANPVSYADCVHWCLPGLQDTWNELLYTKLFYP